MLRRLTLPLLLLLLLVMPPASPAPAESDAPPAQGWWDNYARDRNHDGLSDLLVWKLAQGDRFFAPEAARVFVSYDHRPTDDDVARLAAAGAEVTYRARYLDLLAATVPRELVRELAEWPGVVMLDDIGRAVTHMNEAVPAMGVDQVWETYGYDGEGVAIAVIDTGIDGTHVGLDDLDDNNLTDDPKIIGYYNAIEDQEYPANMSEDSGTHGTHVAGIAAGTGDGDTAADGSRYIGVAPGAYLVNVLSCCAGDIEDIIRGIEWTIANQERFGIRIMTSSLGEQQVEYHVDNDGNSAWSRAADAAVEAGIVVTLSAGNEFGAVPAAGCQTVDAPGDSRKTITVAALDKDMGLAAYSSRGYTSDGRVKPDVATIGSNIMAPDKGTRTGYTSKSGTSMATPLMAGIVALTLQANPDKTPQEVKDEILANYAINREIYEEADGSNDCSAAERDLNGIAIPDNEYGYGRADPLAFVEAAGKIDATLSVAWNLGPVEQEVNGTPVLVKPEVPNGTWLTGTADAAGGGAQVGVEVRFGASQWYPATDTSSGGDWSSWKVQVVPEVPKGNQTLMARLVADAERMSPVATLSVVLRDEYAPAPEEATPAPGLAWAALLAVAVAWGRRRRRA